MGKEVVVCMTRNMVGLAVVNKIVKGSGALFRKSKIKEGEPQNVNIKEKEKHIACGIETNAEDALLIQGIIINLLAELIELGIIQENHIYEEIHMLKVNNKASLRNLLN